MKLMQKHSNLLKSLAHIGQTTHGASLEANVALVKHNAAVAAEIAAALAALPTLGVGRT